MDERSLVGCKISAIAHFLPETVQTNADIIAAHKLRLNPEWVRLNIGITERRWCSEDEQVADLAAAVLRQLLGAGLSEPELSESELSEPGALTPEAIGALILATVSNQMMTPATAAVVQSLVTPGAFYPCFDVTAACSGFIYGIDIGRRYVQTGVNNVVCIAAETRSKALNKQDRRTVMLFGDGAAGVVLSACEPGEQGILYSKIMADGRHWDAISVPVGGTITMKEAGLIFESAIREMANLVSEGVAAVNLAISDIDQFIFHQASGMIVAKVAEQLGIAEHKTYLNFATRGNMTSASVAVALSEAVAAGRIKKHDKVCLVATGGGFSAGVVILRWEL